MRHNLTLFDDIRMTLDDAIELSLASLREYGARYSDTSAATESAHHLPYSLCM